MTLEITVFDTDRDVVGVIDSAVSLIWTERLRTPGDFELVLTPTQENIDLMTLDNYISIPESDDWMIVESVSIRTDAEEGDTLIVSGRSLLSLWDRRQQYQNGGWGCGGTIPGCSINAVLSFMQLYGFGSADADREVTYMKVDYSSDPRLTDDAAYYIEWSQDFRKGSEDRNILDTIVTMAEAYGVGITMYPDLDTGDLYIHPFLGQDRTTAQVDNPVVIFSPELGNLVNSEVLITKQGYRTFVYIWGAPEPTPQPMYDQELSPKVTGLSRREYWWDGSQISPYETDGTTPKATATYRDELKEGGMLDLNTRYIFQGFTGSVQPTQFIFGTDYFMGDIVEFENGYGFSAKAMVIEITYSKDESGESAIPTFEFISN